MGNILELTTGYFASTTTKTVLMRSVGTQTKTKLTEKLTDFNSVAVSSTEVFDKICDICNLDKEAVGYCWNCEQYLCFRCCSHHEKISLSQEHRLFGKSDFPEVGLKKSLFEQSLIPLTLGSLPGCIQCTGFCCCKPLTVKAIFKSQIIQATGTCFLLVDSSVNQYEFGSIDYKGNYNRIYRGKFSEVIWGKNQDAIGYFLKDKVVHGILDSSTGICKLFEVVGKCTSVISFNRGFAVFVSIPTGYSLPEWQIQFLDLDGNVKKRICYGADGQPLLKTPEHMSCNATSDILYVSDSTKNCIIAIDAIGNIVYKFTHTELQSPKALSCDDEGNIYVACKNKMILIDSHGKKCKILTESRSKEIIGIYYNITDQQLVVTDGVTCINVTCFSVK